MSLGSHCYASKYTAKGTLTLRVKEQGERIAGRGWFVRSAVYFPLAGPEGRLGVTRISALFSNIFILLTFRELLRPFLFLPKGPAQLRRPQSPKSSRPAPSSRLKTASARGLGHASQERAGSRAGQAPNWPRPQSGPEGGAAAGRGGAGRGGAGRAGREEARGRLGCHRQPAPAGNGLLFPAGRPRATDPEPAAGIGVATRCGAGGKPLG